MNNTATQSEGETQEGIIQEALERFSLAQEFYSEEYERGEDDVNFIYGNQWPQDIESNRTSEGRPCLTENHCLPFVHQVVNNIRQSRPAITVKPVDSESDPETADVLKGIIRNIEVTSDAETAYDTSAFCSTASGYGYIRVNTRYIPNTFEQELYIDRVLNWQSVYLDPNHKKLDGSDARYGFIFDDMDKGLFEKNYPDVATEGFDKDAQENGWISDNTIRVCEYFRKVPQVVKLVNTELGVFKGGQEPEGVEILEEREETQDVIEWYKLTAKDILEDTEWPGIYIPIVPVYGEEVYQDGKRKSYSLIHQARDPQQMYNYYISANTEILALQPKAPYIGAVGQFETAQDAWREANKRNFAVLEYDLIDHNGVPVGPPQRQAPPQGSAALMQETMRASQGIKQSLGMFDASMGARGNEVSGTAIAQRQMQGDNATFHFIDNLATSLKQVGCILVDLIPKIYSGQRIARIIGDDGEEELVPINQPAIKLEDGRQIPAPIGTPNGEYFRRDIYLGKYDVVVDVGPSYATKRQEAVESMLEIARIDPRIMQVAGDILFRNLDIPNAKELSDRIKSVMDPSLLGDDPAAAKLMQAGEAMKAMEQQLMQMQESLKAKQDDQAFKNGLEAKKVELEAQDLQIKAAKTQAEIAKLQAESQTQIPAEAINDVVEALVDMNDRMTDVGGAVDVILSERENGVSSQPQGFFSRLMGRNQNRENNDERPSN